MIFKIIVCIFLLCGLIFSHAAAACSFADAEYIPDPKDFRLKTNYYYYKITLTPDLHFIMSIIDPLTKRTETRLKMNYAVDRDADPAATLSLTRSESLAVEFFNKDLIGMPVYRGSDVAPASMILRDSQAKFLNLGEDGLDIEYLTDKKVKPGALVEGHLELIPDVWVFNRCLKK